MLLFAQTADAIAATAGKLAKRALAADYFRSQPPADAAIAAIFLSGRPFPAYEEATLQVGGALLWRVIAELSGKSESQLTEIYRRRGDAGAVAADALPARPVPRNGATLSLETVQHAFAEIASARGPAAKSLILRQLLERATPLEAKYIVKIISGDLRIGFKESLVEESIAQAFDVPLDDVKRANMMLGDLGETLILAASNQLASARLRLFHPIDFMLASPVESAEKALSYFDHAAVEDKYDGIRAQAHISNQEVRLFSRTRDEITESFPELPPALAGLPSDAILDGEILAWQTKGDSSGQTRGETNGKTRGETKKHGSDSAAAQSGRALPFSTLQRRLGRKKVSAKLMSEVPVAYLVFDVLYANGELLIDRPLHERAKILDQLLAADRAPVTHSKAPQFVLDFAVDPSLPATVLRAPVAHSASVEALEQLFTAARDRGNEGLMIKDLDSLYTPGRRGKSWLKMKRELASLDVVVTAVEYGHGKRIKVLSDYTFAVWDGDRLVNIGKAYSGLTDVEIAEMTKWFLAHQIGRQGSRLEVEPKIVLEVAFNNMMRSTRHESGYALRFPRILRLRPDKLAADADTVATVKEIFERQQHPS
jgi:DNA ligase-1